MLSDVKVAYGKYDFAVNGGAISTITLAGGKGINKLPVNAVILGGTIDVTTALASGGSATISLGTTSGSSASSLKSATAVASWTGAGQLALTPVFTAGTMVKMTAAGSITATIAAAALTAGVFEVHLLYVVSSS